MKLYDAAPSGNCHKARLLLSMLKVPYETVPVALGKKEQKTPEYLAKNPLGQVPLLEDDGYFVHDSQAILVYLAKKYGKGDWLPDDAKGMGEVMQWVVYAANEVAAGPRAARGMARSDKKDGLPALQQKARDVLKTLDDHLKSREWLACGRPTIGDIAVYPYTALSGEAGITMSDYPNVQKWIRRVEALPGYVAGQGLPAK
jgi:glutathione S-transferase